MPTPADLGASPQSLTTTDLDLLLDQYPQIAGVLVRHAMLCVGCPIARFHTLEDAAALYGVELVVLVEELTSPPTPLQSGEGL